MVQVKSFILPWFLMMATILQGQTLIPNAGFENWTQFSNYSNPTSWDTPNEELMAIPFFGTSVVTKSADHHGTGSFSAKLESKHITIPPIDVQGFMITANLTLNITSMTYTISGGAPIFDQPTHLKGFYKYIPKGGDSCLIGIGLFKHINGIQDTIGHAEFSTKDTVNDWTNFSKWITYDIIVTPDTMQVYAFSTAQAAVTPGTVLYVDDLYLDYTVGFDKKDPNAGINVYNDRETNRLIVFCEFPEVQNTSVKLISMTGETVRSILPEPLKKDRIILPYANLPRGIYLLVIMHGDMVTTKKFFLNTQTH